MGVSKFSIDQIKAMVEDHQNGLKLVEIVKKYNVSEPTFYRLKRKYGKRSKYLGTYSHQQKSILRLQKELQREREDNQLLKSVVKKYASLRKSEKKSKR